MPTNATPLKVVHGTGGPRERAARAHRRIRRGMVAVCAALLPALWAAGRFLPGIGASMAVLAVALAIWFALAVALFRFRCPSCKQPFHRGPVLDLFTTSCVRCGVELGRPGR
jgi:hypothetical protein